MLGDAEHILALQRTVGNHVVTAMLEGMRRRNAPAAVTEPGAPSREEDARAQGVPDGEPRPATEAASRDAVESSSHGTVEREARPPVLMTGGLTVVLAACVGAAVFEPTPPAKLTFAALSAVMVALLLLRFRRDRRGSVAR